MRSNTEMLQHFADLAKGNAEAVRKGYTHKTHTDPLVAVGAARTAIGYAESMEWHAVQRAREAGVSWAEIASALSISKQAAHKKFGAGDPPWMRPSL
jgi:hypothetical protein